MQNRNEVTQTDWHRSVQRLDTEVSNLKIPILRETRETIPRTWSSKMSLLSNFTPRMSRLGLARIETPDKTKSPRGNMAHVRTFWTIPDQLVIIIYYLYYYTITSPIHQNIKQCISLCITKFICLTFFCVQYFLAFRIFGKECITDTGKCNISRGI